MGFIPSKTTISWCCSKKTSIDNDFCLFGDDLSARDSLAISKIQAVIRGFILRNKIFPNNFPKTREISMDYSTDSYENNPIILRLSNLLPKFELSEKETYAINNSNLKIVALLYPNNSIYKGMVDAKGLREGFGKLYLKDGSVYKGFFHQNTIQGRGRMMNINGFVYDGEFDNGLSHGYGKYVALDGTTYKGSWTRDKQCGFGDETYPDGSHYTGNFRNGRKNGQGKLTFSDQNVYEGSFVDNKIKGEGTYHWKDGRVFVGSWTDNRMQGYGIFLWPDKKKYYGHYYNNNKEGFGIFYWGDGHKFEGFWKDGRQHGYGTVRGAEKGNLKYGQWYAGKFLNKINDRDLQRRIDQMIEKEKSSKEFVEFMMNIERYEKYLGDSLSGQETGVSRQNGGKADRQG